MDAGRRYFFDCPNNPRDRSRQRVAWCSLLRDVKSCFARRVQALPTQVPATPERTANEAVARLAGIHSACLTGASMERGYLVDSRSFLESFLRTNCQPMPTDVNRKMSCESAQTASECILRRIDRLGNVNRDNRIEGKPVPGTGTGLPRQNRANPQ